MILYFSGTGNSRHVAQSLSARLGESLPPVAIAASMQAGSQLELQPDEPLGFVFPIYSWGVPPIVISFVGRMKLSVQPRYVYFVCTCGDETGLAPQQFAAALGRRGLECSAGYSVIMPNNYVLLPGFDVDPVSLSDEKLQRCAERIEHVAARLAARCHEVDCTVGPMAWLKSKLVYPLFVRWGVFTSKFHTADSCVGCGLCATVCPVGNITMGADRRPHWGSNCTSCVACYHVCPHHAAHYGGATRNKGQYNKLLR
jgi:ferredoxin